MEEESGEEITGAFSQLAGNTQQDVTGAFSQSAGNTKQDVTGAFSQSARNTKQDVTGAFSQSAKNEDTKQDIISVTNSVEKVKLNSEDINGGNVDSVTEHATSSAGEESAPTIIASAMLLRVAGSDAHFKHQQRGEPDLTIADKQQIAAEILQQKPVMFLARFGRYLVEEDLVYFKEYEPLLYYGNNKQTVRFLLPDINQSGMGKIPPTSLYQNLSEQYEINFYLADIRRLLDDKKNDVKKRNRRFEAMKVMMEQGEYFSADSMQERDPLLYEQLIGRYLTDAEIGEKVKGRDVSMSAVLMGHVQSMANSELYNRLCDIEEGQMEEEDEDDEIQDGRQQEVEEEEEEEETEAGSSSGTGVEIASMEKQMLKNEFLRTMQLRFLNGEDNNFDYRSVDEDATYDSLEIREHDEEEKYFDQSEDDLNDDDDFDLRSCDSAGSGIRGGDNSRRLTGKDVGGAGKDSGTEDLDYEQYTVDSDVCPGLNSDSTQEKAGMSDNRTNARGKQEVDGGEMDCGEKDRVYKWGEYNT